jgi:uncharacterized phage protein gp47/JayE
MVNEQGYIRPTYDELLESRIEQAKRLFGDDIDTSNASPLGKFIRLSVQDLADAYEAQEIIYYSRFPNTATGHSLDRLMPFAGITRNAATRAEHEIQFTGTADTEIPVGFLVGTTGEEEFYLVNHVTLDSTGVGVGIVQCTELGSIGNVPLGSITEIINPDVNVSSINHMNIEQFAKDEETDEELRERFLVAIEGAGSGTVAAIRGAVMRIEGVGGCLIAENSENTADSEGRPPHSFEVYVYAPETLDQQIANAIFEKKPLGIKSVGDVSVTVTDVSGGEQIVRFSRVAEVSLYIKAIVAVNTHFELDGEEQIKTALLGYVNHLTSGDDVIFTSLYKHIFGVTGVMDVTSLSISTNGSTYVTKNITMSQSQVANLKAENITIEVTNYADS